MLENFSALVHSQTHCREHLFTVAIASPVRVANFCFPPFVHLALLKRSSAESKKEEKGPLRAQRHCGENDY